MPDHFRQNILEAMLPQVYSACPVGLVLLGPDGQVDFNPAARQVLDERVGDGELAWRRWALAAVARLAATGQLSETLPGVREPDQGLEVSRTPDSQEPWQILALVRANKGAGGEGDLQETVSTLSHELRTPLASMKSSLNLVINGDAGELQADQRHFLEMTLRNINRLDRLVGDLLDVSRADAGYLNLRPRWMDLVLAVSETVENHRETAREAGLALEFQGTENELWARLDADKLARMVTNLLTNALKYTPHGGRVGVALTVDQDGKGVRLEVRDNGPGMDPETAANALQPYQRSVSATQSAVPGAGLGLHITQRLASAMGGQLGLDSCPGQGTSAWIELPLDGANGPQNRQSAGETLEV